MTGTNAHPIKKPGRHEKGLKFRVMEQPVYIEMMKSLWRQPHAPMAMSELYTALQKGRRGRWPENPSAMCHQALQRSPEVRLSSPAIPTLPSRC